MQVKSAKELLKRMDFLVRLYIKKDNYEATPQEFASELGYFGDHDVEWVSREIKKLAEDEGVFKDTGNRRNNGCRGRKAIVYRLIKLNHDLAAAHSHSLIEMLVRRRVYGETDHNFDSFF